MKPKYGNKANLCYMVTSIINIKSEHVYKDIVNDVENH